jgi:hypothetical protein
MFSMENMASRADDPMYSGTISYALFDSKGGEKRGKSDRHPIFNIGTMAIYWMDDCVIV